MCLLSLAFRYGKDIGTYELSLIWGFTVAIFAVGGMLGSFCTTYATEYFGRKRALILNNILAVTAAVLMGFSNLARSYEMLIIGTLCLVPV